MKRFVKCLALVLAIGLLPIAVLAEDENYIGEIIWVDFNHAPSHCYAPAHLYENGLHRVWFCNWDQRLGKVDAIWYTQKEGDLSNPNGWTKPVQVHNMQINPDWIANHTADPVVIRGNFTNTDGQTYTYALYFTADDGGGTLGNTIGLSFSNDGLNWVPYGDGPVIRSDGESFGQRYEAGMNTVAWDPANNQYVSIIFDSEVNNGLTLRTSKDGIDWGGYMPATYLPYLSTPDYGKMITGAQGPDLAYCTQDQHWYAAVKCPSASGVYDGRSVVVRSKKANDLTGMWDVIQIIDESITGNLCNHNPGLSKTGAGELYVDENGYFYCFFGTGNTSMDGTINIGEYRIALPQD